MSVDCSMDLLKLGLNYAIFKFLHFWGSGDYKESTLDFGGLALGFMLACVVSIDCLSIRYASVITRHACVKRIGDPAFAE